MLQVSVVDSTAEKRLETIEWLQKNLEQRVEGIEFLPRMAFKPVSVSELKFQSVPDLIVIGSGLAAGAADDLSHIRQTVPGVPLILLNADLLISLAAVEYLARIGIEEVFPLDIQPGELLRRLVMISSKIRRQGNGRLIVVDAAKGGVGATTVASGLGELAAESGSRVLLIDADEERQSLSRFLQARPFMNEALQDLIAGARPVTPEFVEQCAVQVWKDLPGLWCMSPGLPGTLDGTLSIQLSRTLISILETLEQLFDYIIVDAGSARGTWRRILLRGADRVIFVCDGDPASAFASFERVRKIREEASPDACIHMLENRRTQLKGLSQKLLRSEFERYSGIQHNEWCSFSLPFCSRMAKWPGSGMTSYGASSRRCRRDLEKIARETGVVATVDQDSSLLVRSCARCLTVLLRLLQKRLSTSRTDPIPIDQNRGGACGSVRELGWERHGNALAEELLVTPPQPIQV